MAVITTCWTDSSSVIICWICSVLEKRAQKQWRCSQMQINTNTVLKTKPAPALLVFLRTRCSLDLWWNKKHSALPCFFSQLTAQPKTSCTSFPSSVTSPISPIRFTSGRCSSDTWWPSTCSCRERQDVGTEPQPSLNTQKKWKKKTVKLTKSSYIMIIFQHALQNLFQVADLMVRDRIKKSFEKSYWRVFGHILPLYKLPWGASWPRSPPWSCLAMSH